VYKIKQSGYVILKVKVQNFDTSPCSKVVGSRQLVWATICLLPPP